VTGVLGVQPQPTVGELFGWLLYAVPMLAFVLWPDRWRRRATFRTPVAAAGHRATT
jgi:high-affinity iron transporter